MVAQSSLARLHTVSLKLGLPSAGFWPARPRPEDRIPRIVVPEPARVVVLSPHHDDAVFSAFGLLGADAHVVNVCAAMGEVRADDTALTQHVAASGFTSAAELHAARLIEDAAALAITSATYDNLEFVDAIYPRDAAAERRRLTAAFVNMLRASAEQLDVVAIPAGVGGHPNHIEVRDCFLSALRVCGGNASGQPLEGLVVPCYADVPYALRRLTAHDDEATWIPRELLAHRAFGTLHRTHTPFRPDQAERKAAAIACYTTQADLLSAAFGVNLTDPVTWSSGEVAWTFATRP